MNLQGKKALVTGSGRGIGKGCALALANNGADVIINDRPGSPDAQATAEEIRSIGRKSSVIEADVFTRDGCEKVIAETVAQLGRLDILISNPAYNVRCKFLDCEADTFDKVIQGTLAGGFHAGQLAARQMVKQGTGGKIVYISSVHAHMPYARSAAYNAAKAGLNHMARTMAVELFPHRINVNLIEPGWIDTPAEHQEFGDKFIEEQAPKLPWGRIGRPEDIGNAAAFLASAEADYMTGTVIRVDGGFVLKDCQGDSLTPDEQ